jgi:hypothetical protein
MQIKAMLTLGILVGFGAVSTLAAWTGTATATSNISSATVALGVGATADAASATTYQMPITGSNLYPGTSSVSTVLVKNTGTISAPYTVQGKVTESGATTLGAGLNISLKIGATVSGSGANVTCSGGTTIVSKSAGAQFNGSSIPRTVDSGASESLCIQYALPTTAANSLQGATTSIGLTFTSTVGS